MTTELTVLAYSGLLALLLTLIQGTRGVVLLGLPTAAGNQHDVPAWTGWNDRLNRALRNHIEALVIFVPVVLAVQLGGLNNETTAHGCNDIHHRPRSTCGAVHRRGAMVAHRSLGSRRCWYRDGRQSTALTA